MHGAMYSLDVNFLKDRAPQKSGFATGGSKTRMSAVGQTPLFVGAAVAAVIPVVVGLGGCCYKRKTPRWKTN